MKSTVTRIRTDYAPLSVAVSMVVLTPNSPVTQVFDVEENEYRPDRSLTPTVILPQVVANANDGNWPEPHSNHALADMKWTVNGKDIATLPEWTGKYTIHTDGSMRGALSISHNIPVGTQVALQFEAVLADTRLGVNIPVKSEQVVLSTSSKAEDSYALSLSDDQIIQYDPFKDKLHLYGYKVAHGLVAASASAKDAATDENSYLRTIPVTLHQGENVIGPGDYDILVYRIKSATSYEGVGTAMTEFNTISSQGITLDLRLVDKADYLVKAFIGINEVASRQFSVNRLNRAYSLRLTNGTDISPSDTQRYDEVMVDTDGNTVECPGSIIRILWKSNTEALKDVTLNEGEQTLFDLTRTGIGRSHTDSWLELYTLSEVKGVHSLATDQDGYDLTDESGNSLIFN